MRNISLIIKNEIITTFGKLSFWVMTFIFPALILVLSVGMQTFGTKAIEKVEAEASSIEQAGQEAPIGVVDSPNLLESLPPWVPEGYLKTYPSEGLARLDLETGKINQYYVIESDFIETGNILLVDQNFQPLRSSGNAEIIGNIINDVLISKDPLGAALFDPTNRINGNSVSPEKTLDKSDPISFAVPMATLFIFFFVITTSSGFMLNSVTKEKENRTAEALLVSLEPRQLMVGKVVGLGVIALFQMSIWLSGSVTALGKSDQFFNLVTNYSLPSGFIIWALIYFILGYFLYASILGTIGVLVPNAREGGQFTFLAVLPLLIPLWFNYTFTESPDGLLSIILSIFPLTAPSSMIARLTVGNVPIWQLVLSIIGLVISAYLFVLLASHLFRADTLLSNESLNWKRIKTEINRFKADRRGKTA